MKPFREPTIIENESSFNGEVSVISIIFTLSHWIKNIKRMADSPISEIQSIVPIARHNIMAAIKSRNTKPELLLRHTLWQSGLRYRVNYKKLPGKPDIIIKKYKLAIFVDGEFWHGKDWLIKQERIHTRREFWIAKIERNMQRDQEVNAQLNAMGYQVFRYWESDLQKNIGSYLRQILNYVDIQKNKGFYEE